mgnify:CR=1 FL=1
MAERPLSLGPNPRLAGSGMTSERARARMVEMLRQAGVKDERVLAVMGEIPRHLFVDDGIASRAYDDTALPIGFGQTISSPVVVAIMTAMLRERVRSGKVLEIGKPVEIQGQKGTLKASVYSYDYVPNDRGAQPVHKDVTYEFEQYPEDRTEKDLERHVAPAIRGHMKDLLANIDSRGKPVADIEQGYISTSSCILANLSMQLGRSLKWDPVKGRIVGDEEANKLLRRPYRKPWEHPDPARV